LPKPVELPALVRAIDQALALIVSRRTGGVPLVGTDPP
jgi:hypothetical protein